MIPGQDVSEVFQRVLWGIRAFKVISVTVQEVLEDSRGMVLQVVSIGFRGFLHDFRWLQ